MAVTIEVKQGQTATVAGPATVRVVGAPDALVIGDEVITFPRAEVKDGETAEVTGPAIMVVKSDVVGSVLIDGEPVTKPPEPPPVETAPTISALDPSSAIAGDAADIVMLVTGTGFTDQSVIVFNGYDEPTTLIDDTQVSTGVKPSLFVVPADCPVTVRNGALESNALTFSFTSAAGRSSEARRRR